MSETVKETMQILCLHTHVNHGSGPLVVYKCLDCGKLVPFYRVGGMGRDGANEDGARTPIPLEEFDPPL